MNDAGIQPITGPRKSSVADRGVNSMDSSEINPKGSKPLLWRVLVRSSTCRKDKGTCVLHTRLGINGISSF